ncbi:MAG: hypothetical protein JWM80_3166 [Cyanobacteria bacterium RYN_339]|nr:hypothetical protein [Cyanobacteria bacterium RYN_339]
MANCNYHPDSRGTANCLSCHHNICDRCRLNGTAERCMTCQSVFSKGGQDDGRSKRTMCINHEGTPTDTKCKQCRKPHCIACLNSANMCFRCAMAGPRQPTGTLKAKGTAPLKATKQGLSLPAISPKILGGGLAAVALVGLLGYGLANRKGGGEDAPFMGKSGIEIVAPAAGGVLKGSQVIKVKVKSKEAVEKVEITIDGKYWEKWTAPEKANLESDWPTGVFKNGPHEIVATVKYRGGRRMAADKRKVSTRNR